MSYDAYTENIGDFGYRELELAAELLEAARNGYPSDFDYKSGTKLAFNRNSGEVFLTNDEYQACVAVNEELYSLYTMPYSGQEGVLIDLVDEYCHYPDEWDEEDIEYLWELCRNEDIVRDNSIFDDDVAFVLGNEGK